MPGRLGGERLRKLLAGIVARDSLESIMEQAGVGSNAVSNWTRMYRGEIKLGPLQEMEVAAIGLLRLFDNEERQKAARIAVGLLQPEASTPLPEPDGAALQAPPADPASVQRLARDRAHHDMFTCMVLSELEVATEQYGPIASLHEGYAVLREELDEFWDDVKLKPHSQTAEAKDRMLLELVQVAAMCYRVALDQLSPKHEAGVRWPEVT